VAAGTVAGLRFEVRGMRDGRAVCVLEHVTRLRDDVGPDWPQPAGDSCYRVVVTGEPNYTVDLQLLGTDGDHNTAGLKATAMRLVNAVERSWPLPRARHALWTCPVITGRGWWSEARVEKLDYLLWDRRRACWRRRCWTARASAA
jgi:4-hydroxy-tetrahydrodipicolinate reductase